MKERDTLALQREYMLEDALIELMLEVAIEEKGLSALNVTSDSEAFYSVPTDITNQNIALINDSFTRKKLKAIRKHVVFVLKLVFLSFAISMTVFIAAFKCVPGAQKFVYDTIVGQLEGETQRKVGKLLGFEIPIPPEIDVHWVPEGYTLNYSTPGMSSTVTWSSYKNSDNKEITIDVYDVSSGIIGLDTEDAEIKNIEINGFPTMVILKETHNQIAIMNDSILEMCVIYSDYAPVEDLIKIAKGIEFK